MEQVKYYLTAPIYSLPVLIAILCLLRLVISWYCSRCREKCRRVRAERRMRAALLRAETSSSETEPPSSMVHGGGACAASLPGPHTPHTSMPVLPRGSSHSELANTQPLPAARSESMAPQTESTDSRVQKGPHSGPPDDHVHLMMMMIMLMNHREERERTGSPIGSLEQRGAVNIVGPHEARGRLGPHSETQERREGLSHFGPPAYHTLMNPHNGPPAYHTLMNPHSGPPEERERTDSPIESLEQRDRMNYQNEVHEHRQIVRPHEARGGLGPYNETQEWREGVSRFGPPEAYDPTRVQNGSFDGRPWNDRQPGLTDRPGVTRLGLPCEWGPPPPYDFQELTSTWPRSPDQQGPAGAPGPGENSGLSSEQRGEQR